MSTPYDASKLGNGILSPEAIMPYEMFSRVGNNENGEAYIRTQKANEKILVDDTGTYVYVGYAIPGSNTSTTAWKIKRIKTTNVVEILYADGNAFYDNVWNNRASLTYN